MGYIHLTRFTGGEFIETQPFTHGYLHDWASSAQFNMGGIKFNDSKIRTIIAEPSYSVTVGNSTGTIHTFIDTLPQLENFLIPGQSPDALLYEYINGIGPNDTFTTNAWSSNQANDQGTNSLKIQPIGTTALPRNLFGILVTVDDIPIINFENIFKGGSQSDVTDIYTLINDKTLREQLQCSGCTNYYFGDINHNRLADEHGNDWNSVVNESSPIEFSTDRKMPNSNVETHSVKFYLIPLPNPSSPTYNINFYTNPSDQINIPISKARTSHCGGTPGGTQNPSDPTTDLHYHKTYKNFVIEKILTIVQQAVAVTRINGDIYSPSNPYQPINPGDTLRFDKSDNRGAETTDSWVIRKFVSGSYVTATLNVDYTLGVGESLSDTIINITFLGTAGVNTLFAINNKIYGNTSAGQNNISTKIDLINVNEPDFHLEITYPTIKALVTPNSKEKIASSSPLVGYDNFDIDINYEIQDDGEYRIVYDDSGSPDEVIYKTISEWEDLINNNMQCYMEIRRNNIIIKSLQGLTSRSVVLDMGFHNIKYQLYEPGATPASSLILSNRTQA